jgi:lysophospholipase
LQVIERNRSRRRSWLAAVLLLLAACRVDDPRAPFTDSEIPPGLETRFYPPEGWAWGLVKAGDAPAARYGVGAPAHWPRADIMILTGWEEPAEAWFETIRALNGKGYVVWVLEPVGAGGSGRYGLPRDLRHAPSLQPDVTSAVAMAQRVIGRRPLILIAAGSAAPTALSAVGAGLKADALILTSPQLEAPAEPDPPRAQLMRAVMLGGLRADGGQGWRRDGPDDVALGLTHDATRGRVRLAWQTANPDLRQGGASYAWNAAFTEAAVQALGPGAARITAPTLILAPDHDLAASRKLCTRLNHCTLQPFGPSGSALNLEVDEVRNAWLSAITAFIEPNIARFSPPPMGASGA